MSEKIVLGIDRKTSDRIPMYRGARPIRPLRYISEKFGVILEGIQMSVRNRAPI
jgi:hypothetical protein